MKTTIGRRAALCLALILCLSVLSIGASAASGDSTKVIVAVTIVPEKAFVEAVAGDHAEIVVMVPPGNSPGNYEPTPLEMKTFATAQIYFTIGVPTEAANILPQAKEAGIAIVDLASIVAEQYPERMFSAHSRDPHIWLSPKRAIVMINTIADELSALDPDRATVYAQNAAAYVEQLTALDEYMAAAFDSMTKKAFISYHPAYGYIADDYGLTMYELQEDGKDATAQDLAEVVDWAKTEGITTIFSQAEIDSPQPDAFAEEIGGQKVMLDPLSGDYINNMMRMADEISASMQ